VGKPLALVRITVGRGIELEVGNRREQEGLPLGVRPRYAIGAFRYGKSRLVRRVNLSLPDDFVSLIEARKPRSLTLTAFCAVLIEQGLTQGANLPAYCVGAGTPEDQKDFLAVQHHETSTPVPAVKAQTPQQPSTASAAPSGARPEIPLQQAELLPDGEKIEPAPKKNTRAKDRFSNKRLPLDAIPSDLLDCQQLLVEFWSVKKGVRSEGVYNRICTKLRGWTPEDRRASLERAISSGWGDVFEPPTAPASRPSSRSGSNRTEQLLNRLSESGWLDS